MTATEKWIAGTVGLTWTNLFNSGADINSIVNGNAIMSSTNCDNSSNLDIFADVSVALGSITSGAGAYLGLYLYPLNQDGSAYGDGRFGSSAAGPPPSQYFVGQIGLVASVTQAQNGIVRGIIMPPGQFKFVIYNQSGATLAGSGGNTCQYRTYNRAIS